VVRPLTRRGAKLKSSSSCCFNRVKEPPDEASAATSASSLGAILGDAGDAASELATDRWRSRVERCWLSFFVGDTRTCREFATMAAKSKRWSVREICGGAHFRASLIVTEAHFNYENVKVITFE